MPAVPLLDSKTKHNMKMNTIDGTFAVASDNLTNPYLGLFALSLGATTSQIGMLNAFPAFLGNILQIPYGILGEKVKDRRKIIIIGSIWNRLSWILMGFIPFMAPPKLRVPIIILIATLRVVGGNLGVPAWTSIQAELIPREIRGNYYSNRNIILNISGLIATLVAGKLLTIAFPNNYRVLFVIAFILGIFSLISFTKIKIEQLPESRKQKGSNEKRVVRIKNFVQTIGSDRTFSNYCLSTVVWNIGVTLVSPLISIYFIKDLTGTAEYWAYIQAAGTVAGILCQKFWGPLVDVFGQKNVMSKSGIGVVLIPFLWFLAPNYAFGILINFWGGFMWGGYNLAAFNLLLEVTPDENRSMYIGIYNTLAGAATAVGPLVGGFLAEIIGLRYLFLLSFIGRGIGLFLLYRNVDDSSDKQMQWKDLKYPFQRSRYLG